MIEYDTEFEYDIDVGYEQNFEKWLRWNNRERRLYGEKERTVEEGKKIFRSIKKILFIWNNIQSMMELLEILYEIRHEGDDE
jgi:hypothetical protein